MTRRQVTGVRATHVRSWYLIRDTEASTGVLEKRIVLEFCLLLRDQMEKTGKYRVAMTRTDDTFVALRDRVALARSRQASLFISVHADALRRGEGQAQGATVYTLSE